MLILSNPVDKVKVIKNLAIHPSVVDTSVSYFVHNSAKGNSQLIKISVSSRREFNYMR